MKFGIVQPINLPGIENVPINRRENNKKIESLFQSGADVVVLPELANSQYMMNSLEEVESYSEPLDGPSVSQWSEIASSFHKYIAGGILERDGNCFYNTAVLVGPDGDVGHYRKVHLFNWEKKLLATGNLGFPAFELKEFGIRAGMLICYDLRFPEAVRTMALKGCDVILVPTTWTSIGKKVLWDRNGYCHANYLAIAHAHTNRMAFVCANRAGKEGNTSFLGASIILDSRANVVSRLGSKLEADQIIGELDPLLSRNKTIGEINHLIEDRKPEYYFTE